MNQTGIVSSVPTKITFGTELYDLGNFYDTANSRWTPPAGSDSYRCVHFTHQVLPQAVLTVIEHLQKRSAISSKTSIAASAGGESGCEISVDDIASGTRLLRIVCDLSLSGNRYSCWARLYLFHGPLSRSDGTVTLGAGQIGFRAHKNMSIRTSLTQFYESYIWLRGLRSR